jgi:hypothetical protein
MVWLFSFAQIGICRKSILDYAINRLMGEGYEHGISGPLKKGGEWNPYE